MTITVCASIAGILTFFAFLAHTIVGTREFWRFKPPTTETDSFQSWLQGVAGWQFASIDLMIAWVVFLLIAFTQIIAEPGVVLALLAAYFFVVGTCWLATIALVGKSLPSRWWKLGQWIFCYLVAALALIGSLA